MKRRNYVGVLGRVGYSAKAVVYALIGWMAMESTTSHARKSLNSEGAVREVWKLPLGSFFLLLLTVGLLSFALWRLLQVFLDTEEKGKDPKGLFARLVFFISAIVYGNLGFYSAGKLFGNANAPKENEREGAEALLSLPLGWIFVLIVGLIFCGVGFWQIYRAYSGCFMKQYEKSDLSHITCGVLKLIGRLGIATRAIAFFIIGTFFIKAGWHQDASEAQGLASVFYTIAKDFGPAVVIFMGIGFMIYGLYCFSRAAFRSF